MKKMLIVSALFGLGVLVYSGCGKKEQAQQETAAPAGDTLQTGMKADSALAAGYACPMHPEETSDKPGKCGKCGMDLEPKQK